MHRLILNLEKRGYNRNQFRRFVRNYCEVSKEFAWSDTPNRKVCFEFETKEQADLCKRVLTRGMNQLGIENE